MQDKFFQNPFMLTKVVGAGDLDSPGYQEISNSGSVGSFPAATACGLAADDYQIIIIVSEASTPLTITVAGTETWADLAALIQAALRVQTSATETVAIVNGKIRVTGSAGTDDSISIEDGSSDPLLAAIDALGATYTPVIETAVAPRSGAYEIQIASSLPDTRDLIFFVRVINDSGVEKPGLEYYYDKATGKLTVMDSGLVELEEGDIITAIATLGTI